MTNEFLKVNVDFPNFKVEISTKDVLPALTELRKVLEKMPSDEDVVYEEFVAEEIRSFFSEPFVKNVDVMSAIRKLLKQEEDYRVATVEIPSTATIDLESDARSIDIETRNVQRAATQLTSQFKGSSVKHGIIHLNGALDDDGRLLVVDHIHKHMPTAQLRAFHSGDCCGKVLVECIFFGDFPEEEE